jgi:Asp-tRNA(Asn)/Glu-tRNA(Gln) amidotransferase A subunit family amidase
LYFKWQTFFVLVDQCALNQELPPGPICGLSARDLGAGLARGELVPQDVVESFLSRAAAVQERINPFTFILADYARARAEESARRIRSGTIRPLEGIPFAVKELTAHEGQPHTLGSVFLRDNVATSSDPTVVALLEAGAIPFARTNTPEFGCATVTDNLLFGETLNPWHRSFGTAGSSGGAAAALAAFATPLAQGTDSAGSLRMPSAACGIVGMKPSHGVVPVAAPDYLETVGHNGPMARDVQDLELMFRAIARPDPTHLAGRAPLDAEPDRQLSHLRVALICSIPGLQTDHDVEHNLRRTASLIADAGAEVREMDFPWSWEEIFAAVKLNFGAVYMPLARRLRDAGAELSDLTHGFITDVEPVTRDYGFTVEARRQSAELHRVLGTIFSEFDLILMPTLQMPAPAAGDHYIDHGPLVNGHESADRWIVAFTVPFNLTSSCPAITLPNGLSRDGLPTAAQLVARPYRDWDLIRWAAAVETMHNSLDQSIFHI